MHESIAQLFMPKGKNHVYNGLTNLIFFSCSCFIVYSYQDLLAEITLKQSPNQERDMDNPF